MSRIPEAQIRPLFDDLRWRLLSRQLQQAKGMEPFLKANGYLGEAEVSPQGRTGFTGGR